MRVVVVAIPLLIGISADGLAQSDTSSGRTVLSALPAPALSDSDRPSDLLQAAQDALATGHPRETQDALEMAQTRLLDRSVALGRTNNPSNDPVVGQISEALRALAEHDRAGSMRLIQAAITATRAQGR